MIKLATKKIIGIFYTLSLLFSFVSNAQNKVFTCDDIKIGVSYFYPKNSSDRFIEIRSEIFLYETNTNTGDSAIWQIKWTGDCTYSLKYVSGSIKYNPETIAFLKEHKYVYEITNVTDKYFSFTGHVDKTSNPQIMADTMWFNEKINIPSNALFTQIPKASILKRNHFGDTSKYAVIYIYRPGKLKLSLGNYLIYFDNNLMGAAENNTGYIFKILKEGTFEIKSKLNKDESTVKLDVKFGNTYYVKSMIHWGMYKGLSNYKLEMAIVKPEDGKIEFADVDQH